MLKQQVEKVIEEKVRPALQRDGGNIQLVDVTDDGIVQVRLQGACAGCPGAMMTLQFGVQKNFARGDPGSHQSCPGIIYKKIVEVWQRGCRERKVPASSQLFT
jgi:Fe-S cluster biogenesis protein NfuA